MKVYKDGDVYKAFIDSDGKTYVYSKLGRPSNSSEPNFGGDEPIVPDTPINYGVELVGNLQNNNGILSGFDANSYAFVNYTLPDNFSSFEFVVRCTMSDFSTTQGLFSTNFESRAVGMTLGISNNLLYPNYRGGYIRVPISGAGVEYWWKYVLDASSSNKIVRVYRRTETTDYELLTEWQAAVGVDTINGQISLGVEGVDVRDRYNRGTFNLNGCHIKVDGEVVWEGVTS